MGKAVLWRASNFSLLTDTHHTPLVKPLVVEQGQTQSKEHRQSIAFRAWNVTGGATDEPSVATPQITSPYVCWGIRYDVAGGVT